MGVQEREPKQKPKPLRMDPVETPTSPPSRTGTAVWRYLLASVLVLHGLLHGIGFAATWRIGGPSGVTATPSFPHLEAGTAPVLALGVLWLLAGAGFVLGGAGLAWRRHWWTPLTACAALLSLGLCTMWWQSAPIGIAADLVVLGFLTLLISPLGRDGS